MGKKSQTNERGKIKAGGLGRECRWKGGEGCWEEIEEGVHRGEAKSM